MKIVVIGAGSIGAHIAYRLAQQGAEVTLVEATAPAVGTSSRSLAWLSTFPQASWQEDPGRARLRMNVHAGFDALQDEIGGDWLHWTGTLTWDLPGELSPFTRAFDLCRERGVALEMLDAKQARCVAPELIFRDDEHVVWERHSGWVDAPVLIGLLIARLQALGGKVLVGQPVAAIGRTETRVTGVTLADGTQLAGDAVVNAAGSWATHVAAMAGVALPLDLVPGLMIYTSPLAKGLPAQVINAPTWIARPDPSGGLAVHWRGETLTSNHGNNGISPQAVVDDLALTIPALQGGTVARTSIGIRAVPPGGPIIGALPWLDGLYFAVSHGGIGWGPTWAHLAARELLGGESVPELGGLRPERFYIQSSGLGRFADDAEQQPA
jgi:glycine/D-amino acid oxidase-like deaminating enzyme